MAIGFSDLFDCPCKIAQSWSYYPRLSIDKEVAPLVSWYILWEHAAALALVWAWVALAGFALAPLLRLRIGLVGVPLVGGVYWTLALYLFPFAGGLDIAAALIGALGSVVCARWWRGGGWMPVWKRWSWSTLILV